MRDQKEVLNADEAANLLNMSRWMLYERTREGYFGPGVVVRFGRSIRWLRKGIHAYLENGGQGLKKAAAKSGGR